MDFAVALQLIMRDPLLVLLMLLNIGVIIVNGATDASNAISTCIGTGAISEKSALLLAACGNYIGLMLMTLLTPAVANTISSLVRLGEDRQAALLALAAAALSIIIWGVAAWSCGIPTSQSHSLIAGLTGAAIAVQGGLAGVNFGEWAKVLYGLAISTVLGFFLGWFFTKAIERVCAKVRYGTANRVFKVGNVAAAIFLA
ncbi:MAG: inorganic phosphate transporter, partial [Firmicutes bacterium]|nr:inorganic phosphate transporter [Bacillota bacterium]